MQKRGQVTAFIILGVVIVILVAMGIYYRGYIVQSLSSLGIVSGVKVPAAFQEVNSYVETCIKDVSEDGIRLLGSQAGYLSIPDDNIPAGPANPFSNRLVIFNGGNMEVPYWYYIAANNIPVNAAPSVSSMETNLGDYIDSNLDNCLANFSGFDKFKITPMAHKTSVTIEKDVVIVDVSFPINAKLDQSEYNFKKFTLDIDAALGKLYSMALQIQDSENTDYFLEDKTYDVLVLNEEIPLSETDFSCSPKVWSKAKVSTDLKRLLSYNIPNIKVKGTEYDLADGHKYFEWSALETSYSGTRANLMYSQSWPLYMDVVPSKGDLLEGDSFIKNTGASEAMAYVSSFFCINQYHFIYDIKYPVLIILHDDESFTNSGLDFQFATQVVIDNNQPRENNATDLNLPDDTTNEICKYASARTTVSVLRPSIGKEYVPVPDADVSYKCITTICPIGKTGKDGSVTANFPACINGAAIAKKDGFHEGKTIFSTNEPSSTSVVLEPYYELNVDVRVLSPAPRSLYANEKVIFNFINKELGYSTSISYPETKKVTIIAGKYDVTSYIIEENSFEVTIQGKEIESCNKVPSGILGVFGVEEEKCSTVKLPATKLKTIVKGGANFQFDVARSDLGSASKVLLYTVADKAVSNTEDLADVYSGISTNAQKSFFVYPRFER
jgi:hypothetical protein